MMVSRTSWFVTVETLLSLAVLVVVFVQDSAMLWFGWAVATAALAGVTLLELNWSRDPPGPP